MIIAFLAFINALVAKPTGTWAPVEMMQLKSISEIVLSPDNETALFVTSESKIGEKNRYISQIYRVKTDGSESPTLFSSTESSSGQPRWSPDGRWIAFISDRSGTRNLYLISATGGEAIPLTQGKIPMQTFRWSPDSQRIVFVRSEEETATNQPMEYRKNRATNRLWMIHLENTESHPITPKSIHLNGGGDFGSLLEEFDWSPDGRTIVFSYLPGTEIDHLHLDSGLASLDLETGHITTWPKKNSYEARPRFSPDGKWVAYITSDDEATYLYDRYVAIRSSSGDQYQRLAASFNEGPYVVGPTLLGWSEDGSQVLFFEPKGTKYHLQALPVDGSSPIEVLIPDRLMSAPSLHQNILGFVLEDPHSPPEVYVTPLDPLQPKQLSHLNDRFLSFPMPKTKTVHWHSKDGLKIEGILTYPIDYSPSKQYPLLLEIHGGPMGFFTESFLGAPSPYPTASFAEAGFFVLRPNPRGSTGYGKSFRAANLKDWGGRDYEDLMSGVDHLIAQGLVDSKKMGVMGWSYGGYMTGWIVTQTDRFKAASLGAAMINLVSMAGTTDLHRFVPDYLGELTENPLYANRSPLSYAPHVNTPCLIQHGISDQRVPLSQAYEFANALNSLGKDSVFIIYPDCSHYFEKPNMELQAMEKNLEWFKLHL